MKPNNSKNRQRALIFLMGAVFATATCTPINAQPGNLQRSRSLVTENPEPERTKAAAESAFAEAQELQNQGTVESLTEAIAKYQEALQLFRAAADLHGEAKTIGSLGTAYSDLGEQQEAINYFNQALELSQAEPHIPNQIVSLVRLGFAYEKLNQLERSISYYERALALLRTTGEKAKEAQILAAIASAYESLGDWEQAIAYCESAIALYEAEQDFASAAHIQRLLGAIYLSLGNNQSGFDSYERALSHWQTLNSHGNAAGALRLMGDAASNLGNYQQAINYYNQALSLWQELGEKSGEAEIFQMLGQLYRELGDFDTGLFYQKQALSLWEELDNSVGTAEMLSEIGSTYYTNLDDTKEALSYYERALSLWRSLNRPAEEVGILNAIGSIYSQSKNYQQAREYLLRSLQLLETEKIPHQEATTLGKLAIVSSFVRDNEQAREYLKRAIAIVETFPEPQFKALEFSRIGNVYYFLNDYEKALKYENQALQLWQRMGDRGSQARELGMIARIERDRGNLNQSLTKIKAAIDIIENLRTQIGSQELRQTYFAQQQDYYQFYIDLLMELHQQNPQGGYDGQALHISERARARSLLELLAEATADIRQGVDPQLLERETNLRERLNLLERQKHDLLSGNHSQQQLDDIKQQSQTLLDQLDRLEAEIRANSPRYANLKYPQPLTLEQIQQQILDDNTLLLEYSLGQERSYLWAVTKDGIASHQLPPQSEIEAAANAFRQAVTQNPGGVTIETGIPLRELLLAPVADRLKDKRLLIVGDGILQYIPFAALPLPNSPTTPLLVENEIVTLSSISTVAIQRQQLQNRTPAAQTVAVLADPVFDLGDTRIAGNSPQANAQPTENDALTRAARNLGLGEGGAIFDRLQYTREEAEKILALVPDSQSLQAFDFQASRQQATSPDLAAYQTIHLATHGLLDPKTPALSGIVLSLFDDSGEPQNGFLRLHDIFNLDLPVELVVLSACKTGLGEDVKGEGLVGLTRGFMYAGAKRVVVSLWSVSDVATSELMAKFYRKMLEEEQNPVTALREAQLEMWKSGQWQSPYYWAAFTVQGDWQ